MKNLMERFGNPTDLLLPDDKQEEWKELLFTIKIQPETLWLQVELESLNAEQAKIWFDDFTMTEVPSLEP